MTQDEIIKLAMDIDGHINDHAKGIDLTWDTLVEIVQTAIAHEREAFKVYVNQVVADREMAVHDAVLAEREACAKVCDARTAEPGWCCADAIRERGEK